MVFYTEKRGRDFVEGGLHQIFIWTQRGETETRLQGNRSLLSCDSDSVGRGCDSKMIPSKSSFIFLDEEEMPYPQSYPRACWCHLPVRHNDRKPCCCRELHVNEWMNEWTPLVDSSGLTMKLVKAVIMDRERISIFWDTCDLICTMIYPVLTIRSAPPLVNPYCFSLVLVRCCFEFTLQYQKPLFSASGGWFVGGAAHCLCPTLDPQRDKSCKTEKQATS